MSGFVPKQHVIWLPCSLTLAGHNKFRLQIPPNRPGICCIATDYTSRPSRSASLLLRKPRPRGRREVGRQQGQRCNAVLPKCRSESREHCLAFVPMARAKSKAVRGGRLGEGCAEQLLTAGHLENLLNVRKQEWS